MPSGNSSASTPMRRRLSTTVRMRSVSFTRNSEASLTVSPSPVAAPSTASTGISSMSAAVRPPAIVAAAQFGMLHQQIAHQLAVAAFQIEDANPSSHPHQKIEQRRARRVQPHPADGQRRPRRQQRGHNEKGRRRQVRRRHQFPPRQLRPPRHRDLPALHGDLRAEFPQRDFGVIARPRRLRNRCRALGKEARQQHARLHLRARHRQRVIDGPQSARPGSPAAETGPRAPRWSLPFPPAAA